VADSPIPAAARIGLSTATPRPANQPNLTAADMLAAGNVPTEVIARSMASSSGGTFRFPLDVPQYFMIFTINTYNRTDWATVGTLSPGDAIALPLPLQMVDQSKVKYDIEPIGFIGAAGSALALGNFRAAGDRALLAGGQALLPGALQGVINAGAQAQGYAVNAFDTVMLKGPTYKTLKFSWVLAPHDANESRQLSLIKAAFDNAKAPDLPKGLASAFFIWPKIFNIAYMNDEVGDMGARLNRFKPCVLTDCTFNFTPGDRPPAFYAGSKAIESMEMTLEFLELEFWLANDPDFSGAW
jgi:hypothetical protein